MERDLRDIKADILARTDIVEIIGQYTRLKRSGKSWTGLCPFHADKKPSFNVNPQMNYYRCWSCGEKGDVITFVQKKENLDFVEALEWLAKRAGVPFERKGYSPEKASEREQMLALNDVAVKFFQERLTKSREAQEYLVRRGLLKETQEKFQIGFAPDDWEALSFHLQHGRHDLGLAARIGLIKARKEEGKGYYDAFRNRLMFPIQDVNGRVIAFGGRAMGDDPAKYLNSEASAIFDKSRTLYGLNFARKKLSGDIPAVFVEGFVDVITAHQAGFTQCVATLGTSMTEDHARMLVRYNPKVIICYDGDAAGIKATLRASSVWESIGVEGAEVRVARLPAGDDPDSLLKRGETSAFQAALDRAIPRVDYQIELVMKGHDLNTDEGRDAALTEAISILASVHSRTARDRYAQKLAYLHPSYSMSVTRALEQIVADAEALAKQAKAAGHPRDQGYPLTESSNRGTLSEQPSPGVYRPPDRKQWGQWPMTRQIIRKGEGGNTEETRRGNGNYRDRRKFRDGPVGDPTPPPPVSPEVSGAQRAERQILRALFSTEWRAYILNRVPPELLITPRGRALLELVARTPAAPDGSIDVQAFLARVSADNDDANFSDFVREVLEDSPFLVSNDRLNEAAVGDCVRRLQKHRQDQTQRGLKEMLKQSEHLSPDDQRACIEQYHQRMRELRGSAPAEEDE